jgi:threonine dehydratase
MIPFTWLQEANRRLTGSIRPTPLTYDPELNIYLKWESRQVTGSFKARGALNKILTLQPWELERGLVAASAGNHGQGVALAASQVGARAVIFASEHATPTKIQGMRSLGAEVRLVPGGYGEAEQAGLAFAAENSATWISPYNDGQVIAGQATLALEIIQQLKAYIPPGSESYLRWLVPVGGGGLCAGVACALFSQEDDLPPQHSLIGVQSEASPFFHAIFKTGSAEGVVELPSLADGLAGPVEENALTIPILKRHLDDILLVTEKEIQDAIRYAWQAYQEIIEGSAAVGLAAVLAGRITSTPAVVVISGGNIQPQLFENIISTGGPL